MSLRDGSAKMSKSDPSDMSRINLIGRRRHDRARRSARPRPTPNCCPTASTRLAERPEAKNLVTIYAALSDRDPQSVVEEFAGKGFGAFKPALADLAVSVLAPIRDPPHSPAGRSRRRSAPSLPKARPTRSRARQRRRLESGAGKPVGLQV